MSSISTTLFAYGLTAVVSMFVAVLIKLMTTVLSSIQQSKVSANLNAIVDGPTSLSSAPSDVMRADEKTDVAAIAAAIYTVIGSDVRIVQIEVDERATLWVASGRLACHASHALIQSHHTRSHK